MCIERKITIPISDRTQGKTNCHALHILEDGHKYVNNPRERKIVLTIFFGDEGAQEREKMRTIQYELPN